MSFWFRFSVEHTRYVFLIAFAIPASLWVLSCSCLFGCSKVLRVEESGQMRIRCRKKLDPDAEEAVMIADKEAGKRQKRRRSVKRKASSVAVDDSE